MSYGDDVISCRMFKLDRNNLFLGFKQNDMDEKSIKRDLEGELNLNVKAHILPTTY